jgi:Protein of unknown function (DUF1592)/Protein of unknown function (DUF1588)/Protein of unknown function (DUF1585)/Protein of unknown function (DUF1595)/Protein of unknown function (DUF1587)
MTRRLWLLVLAACACEGRIFSLGGAASAPDAGVACGGEQFCTAAAALPRLTALEYTQTVQATFGAAAATAVATGLPADGRAGPFVSNDESIVNDDMVAQYQLVAEQVGEAMVPTAATVLGCPLTAPSASCIAAFVDRVGSSLFRGALSAEERATYVTLFTTIQARGSSTDAVRVVVEALLQAPRFLYHVRVGAPVVATTQPGPGAVVRLTGVELAERLSYFLLSGPPDQALLDAAARGELDTPERLAATARRLLADPRVDPSLGRFHTQWLGVDDLPVRSFAEQTYPGVQALRGSLFEETRAFSASVVRQGDARLETLLTAKWTVAPAELRPFYGLLAGTGPTARLELPQERSGLLTHAGFLATHTHDASTQAVHRGKAIRELLLCQTIPPPPANIDPRINADPQLSPRQRLEAKTSAPTCTACHQLMNPGGFLLERFDVTGRSRTMVNDAASGKTFAVDETGALPGSDIDGALAGAAALGSALAHSELVQACVARQWFRYAMGRHEASDADERSIGQAARVLAATGGDVRELVVALVSADAFRYRRSAP